MINSTIASSTAKVNAKVELYDGSTLVTTCTCNDRLQDFTVERVGQNNKFFGFGIIHKLTVHLIDLDRNLTVAENNSFKAYLGYGNNPLENLYPIFYVDSVSRDENTNTLTVVAYDRLAAANEHTVAEVPVPYTIQEFAAAATTLIGVSEVVFTGLSDTSVLNTYYENGGNFEGTENYRAALDAIAEVTQTIYCLDRQNRLIFKRLDKNGAAVLTIGKNDYYDLESGENRVLNTIVSATELGDDLSSSVAEGGVSQYIRNNPFWDIREDRADLLDAAAAAIGGIAAVQFACDWDGNIYLEMGDKIALVAEDDSLINSYFLNDALYYDGTLSELSQWIHNGKEGDAANPTSLGEALKQTYAKVDKQNKTIEIIASQSNANSEEIAALKITTEGISASVADLDTKTTTLETDLKSLDEDISKTAEDLTTLSGELTTLSGEVAGLDTAIDGLNTSISGLDGELDTLSGTVTTHTSEIAALQLKDNEITASVTSVSDRTTVVENDLNTTKATVTENSTAIGELTITTDEINASVSELSTKTTELTTKTDNLDGSITDLTTKVETNEENIGKLEVSTEAIRGTVSNLTTKTTELETKTTNLDGSLTTLSGKVTTNEENIGKLEVSTETISGEVSNLTTKTTELETATENLDGSLTALTTKVTTNEKNIGELEVTTETISGEVSNLKTTTETLTETTTALDGSITSLTTRITANEENIGELEVTTESISGEVSSLQTTTEELTTKTTNLDGSVSTLTTTVSTHTEEIAALQLKDNEITASVSELTTTTESLTTTTEDLTEDVNSLNTQMEATTQNISNLQITTQNITASVSSLETRTNTSIDGLNEDIESLEQSVSTKLTAEDLTIAIEEERRRGAEHVTTSTGFTFNSDGLTIDKSDSELSTNINEDGLSVYRYNTEVLTADNTGVKAQNLHATTYLIVGENTYFADYGTDRAGCFWTGK